MQAIKRFNIQILNPEIHQILYSQFSLLCILTSKQLHRNLFANQNELFWHFHILILKYFLYTSRLPFKFYFCFLLPRQGGKFSKFIKKDNERFVFVNDIINKLLN